MTTRGEYRVGIDFNPSGNDIVTRIKRAAADMIDLVGTIGVSPGGGSTMQPEVQRLKDLAVDRIEEAAMWAVKAATKKPMDEFTWHPGGTAPLSVMGERVDDPFDAALAEFFEAQSRPASACAAQALVIPVREFLRRRGFLSVSDNDILDALIKEVGR